MYEWLGISPEQYDYAARLLVATVLSAIVGLEREVHGRAAGIRTNTLVGTGAALFMILSLTIASAGRVVTEHGVGIPDPGRIAAQIVTGIGFLGAGAIIKFGLNVKGLTTAASLWVVASIGMACGAGSYFLAVMVTGLTLMSLLFLSFFARIFPCHSYRTLTVTQSGNPDFGDVIAAVKQCGKIQSVDFEHNYRTRQYKLTASVRLFHFGTTDKKFLSIAKTLSHNGNICSIRWSK
jgi:putative Mg2+ transporter-C (MgtC) family protein